MSKLPATPITCTRCRYSNRETRVLRQLLATARRPHLSIEDMGRQRGRITRQIHPSERCPACGMPVFAAERLSEGFRLCARGASNPHADKAGSWQTVKHTSSTVQCTAQPVPALVPPTQGGAPHNRARPDYRRQTPSCEETLDNCLPMSRAARR